MQTPTAPATHDMPMTVHPGYLAGPGNQHTQLDAFGTFAEGREDWFPCPEEGLVLLHDSADARIELNLAADADWDRWRFLGGTDFAAGLWSVTFDARTPAEVVMAAARRLAHGLAQPTDAERERQLWSHAAHAATAEALRAEASDANWTPCSAQGCTATFTAPDGTAALQLRDSRNDPVPGDIEYVLRAGTPGREDEWWTAQFSRTVPTSVILAVLRTVTDPGCYTRRASQIPMANRSFLSTHPVARPRPEAARDR
ncbi:MULTISPECIES: DUF317 domain-containing protein [unclassified Kitasatospora]|uniref:DUF317 domain-containing protein n=1 Tax=unclassified Kitasatospora TaxID=2633591 RepID=UPI00070E6175|nr:MULTISPECIES: DUF317 domain-containing protein [unclassified Kitasatospora]KQV20958.1 hypothetical protein ASC99_20885 [Kitasatospora sp. Root107]KRB60388.1 hypothetical protein ASE03_12290 [Kitasatospora sp. Root187]